MLRDLILKNRSYRRFDQDYPIDNQLLTDLVDLARLSASAGNKQPLKYRLSAEPELNSLIFSQLNWAAYLKEWPGPAEGERPSAYIVILGDTRITSSFGCDHGIAAQSILLGATERGLGGCIIASINKNNLKNILQIPDYLEMLLVIALGRPIETVMLESIGPEGDIRYWRDEDDFHHVPKRSLKDIIID